MPQHQNHQASPNSKTRRPRIPSIIHNVKQRCGSARLGAVAAAEAGL